MYSSYFPWHPLHVQDFRTCKSHIYSLIRVRIPFHFEGIRFQTQNSQGDPEPSPLPDLWAAQRDSWQLKPLKDYLEFSQAYRDNLRAKSSCSFHKSTRWKMTLWGERVYYATRPCACTMHTWHMCSDMCVVILCLPLPKTYKLNLNIWGMNIFVIY